MVVRDVVRAVDNVRNAPFGKHGQIRRRGLVAHINGATAGGAFPNGVEGLVLGDGSVRVDVIVTSYPACDVITNILLYVSSHDSFIDYSNQILELSKNMTAMPLVAC